MAFKPSRIKRYHHDTGKVKLNLTSMMDMFTIVLVFLLKVYSTHGQLIQPSEYLTLPKSNVEKPPEVALDLTVSTEWIAVNNNPVAKVSQVLNQKGLIIPSLQKELLQYADEAKKMERLYGTPFTGRATIQGDYRIPYKLLIKVMATCGRAEFPNMRLVVYKKEEF